MKIQGSKTLVTGATGGIGQEIARRLAKEGAQLTISGRNRSVLAQLGDELHCQTIAADLTEQGELNKLLAKTSEIDILVVNAGLPATGLLTEFTVEQIDRALTVNLRGAILLARACCEPMIERGRGQIVIMSSLSGKVAAGGSTLYTTTKFGLRGFALALREDLYGSGVGVSLVMPGFISDVGMFAETGLIPPKGTGTRTSDDVANAVVKAIKTNRTQIDVATPLARVGANLAGLLPDLYSIAARKRRVSVFMAQLAAKQKTKR